MMVVMTVMAGGMFDGGGVLEEGREVEVSDVNVELSWWKRGDRELRSRWAAVEEVVGEGSRGDVP